MTRTLVVTHRGGTSRHELTGEVVIGRSRDCAISLDDHQVSRRHAVIRVGADSRLVVEDLGSHNGTLLLSTVRDDTQTATATQRSAELRLVPNVVTPLPDDALLQVGSALITIETGHKPRPDALVLPGFVVVDPAMVRVLELADRVAPTDLTVLMLGESGTGKDMLARYVHARSPRASRRLVNLNCGALPENLLESELFGYEKGAFTGATATKPGLMEAADGGTLFLDEIGELSPSLQVKLLRVVEDRHVLRVGALEPRAVDVRFIAATNRDLEQQVTAGKFREDLYYRIYGMAIHVPALRERPGDIGPLVEQFIAELSPGKPLRLTAAAADKLRAYPWPGNVRQLRNVIHRALVMGSGTALDAGDLDLSDAPPTAAPSADPERLRELADDAERKRIVDAIEACAGNQTRAAEMLGITRRALVRRLEKYDLPRPRRPRED